MARRVLGSIAVVAVASLLFAVSGCGGGSQSLTKAEFVRKGATICGKFQSEREEEFAKLIKTAGARKEPTMPQREAAVRELLDSYEKAADSIGELTPPAGDEKKVEAMVAAMHEGIETAKADVETLFTSSSIAFGKPNSLTAAYGLKLCRF